MEEYLADIVETNETILVVGAGISGITAVIEAAECGKDVILAEKAPSLGSESPSDMNTFPSCACLRFRSRRSSNLP